ncbi:Zonadhesin [Orchesella cincta]|uniref:Zonadhesin n=1 Tax=Orchesella cincta TaxID=48709 RepID=A0A1D2MAG2_ORCCI|nr:Zonadhesin [Orchesella cincta]
MEFNRSVILFWAFLTSSYGAQEISFNHPNFGVWFDSYVSNSSRVHSNTVENLIPLVSKIATKFSTIMIQNLPTDNDGNRIVVYTPDLIPAAVATFNKFHRQPNQQPVELIMPFTLTYPGDGSVRTNFDMIQEFANEANEIYSGTVKRLIFRHQTLHEGFANVKAYLAYVSRTVDRYKYILGADVLLPNCGGYSKTLPSDLTTLLLYFKQIFFTYYPDLENSGPVATANYFSKMFEHCVEKVERESGSVPAGFRTVWYGTGSENDTQNSLDLVQYWGLMSELAIKLNKMAVLTEAFDTPSTFRPAKFRRQGWWRLVENQTYYNSSQYVFEDKWSVVQKSLNLVEDDPNQYTTVQPHLNTSIEQTTLQPETTTLSLDVNTVTTKATTNSSETSTILPETSTILPETTSGRIF